jgi:hypothetical protein
MKVLLLLHSGTLLIPSVFQSFIFSQRFLLIYHFLFRHALVILLIVITIHATPDMLSSSPLEEDLSLIPWSPSPPRRILTLMELIAPPIPSYSTQLSIALSKSSAAIQNAALPEKPFLVTQNTSTTHTGVLLSTTPTHMVAPEAVKSGKSTVIHGGVGV